MADYRIEKRPEGVSIQVADVAGHQEELLRAFEECQEGRCTCPTNEYEKVASMQVAASDDEMSLHLEAKPGSTFDTEEISACLDYTTAKVEQVSGGGES